MAELLPRWNSHSVESLHGFANISLIAADLDGTFLDLPNGHPSQTLEHLRRSLHLHRYEVELTVATGRTLAGVRPILKGLLLSKAIPLVLYNGSVVVRNRTFTTILRQTITHAAVKRILEISSQYPVRLYAYFYNDPSDTVLHMANDNEYVLGWSQNGRPKYEFNGLPVDWQNQFEFNASVGPSAILIETAPDAIDVVHACLRKIKGITYTRSNAAYIEVRPKGSNKAAGLAAAAQSLHLSRGNILALGDNDNDAEMLAWAGIGVAVSQASPKAIEHSDYVCKYGAVRGAIEVLRLVKQARRYFYQPETHVIRGMR